MASGEARFRAAIQAAQRLPQDVLTQSQMLKLYALSRQSKFGSAPAEPPPEAKTKPLEQAKWEAWRDVRSLSPQQAMDAYSQIIEGLTAMMAASTAATAPRPTTATRAAGASAALPASTCTLAVRRRRTTTTRRTMRRARTRRRARRRRRRTTTTTTSSPVVTRTVWSSGAISLGAGATFEVPLAFDAACRCSYSFEIVSGTGPVAFRIVGPAQASASHTYVSEYRNEHEGKVEVVPPDGSGGGVLIATLDNTASTFSAVDVKCLVALEPRAELQALDDYNSRVALRGLIQRKEATLDSHTKSYARIGREAQAMQGELNGLRERLVQREGELKIKYKQMEQGAEMAELMAQEIHELRVQLRNAP